MNARQVWQAALERIHQRVSPGAYTTWFRGTEGLELRGGQLVVGVSNTFACAHLRQRFGDTATLVVAEAAGRNLSVSFVVSESYHPEQETTAPSHPPQEPAYEAPSPLPVRRGRAARPRPRGRLAAQAAPAITPRPAPATSPSAAQPPLSGLVALTPATPPTSLAHSLPRIAQVMPAATVEAAEITGPLSDLYPRYVFETFVVGTANRLAYAAAEEVARAPGERYNPLLIYGGVGLGKTHLLHAIGHRARAAGLLVTYVTAERFTNEIIEAIRQRTTNEFRMRYRAVDVLLVDDVQFIAGRDSTEEEFFHTFNALHEANKQIVLTSDRIPQAMRHLHDRLRSRFAWGLMADIHPPDFEHRLEILRAKAAMKQLDIAEEVLAYLARPDCESIRALEGLLTRAVAYAQMLGEPLDVSLAKRVVTPIAGESSAPRKIGTEEVLAAVGDHFGVRVDVLRGKSREHQVAWARQVAMYLLREETSASLHRIGDQLGGRDHTTIMHGCARITKALKEPRTIQDLAAIRTALHG
jgi:chromosomal replication initiator protein